jgi:hypothetical protein
MQRNRDNQQQHTHRLLLRIQRLLFWPLGCRRRLIDRLGRTATQQREQHLVRVLSLQHLVRVLSLQHLARVLSLQHLVRVLGLAACCGRVRRHVVHRLQVFDCYRCPAFRSMLARLSRTLLSSGAPCRRARAAAAASYV